MQVAVLCGGLGTRLHGILPPSLAKPMADIAGRPFLEFVLDDIATQGADEFLMLVGHAATSVSDHFGPSYRGIPIRYSHEAQPLGTGGAVRNALALLRETFVLINGDTFARLDYSRLVEYTQHEPLAMGLAWAEDTGRFGAVEVCDNRVTEFGEKAGKGSGYINAGVYGCRRELIAGLEPSVALSFERDLLEPQLKQLKPRFVRASDFIDIGVPSDFVRAQSLVGGPTAGGGGS